MSCPGCGTANPDGARFCTGCGARLALTCPGCGTTNVPTARFCGDCGTPLAAGAATTGSPSTTPPATTPGAAPAMSPLEPAARVSERRLVTVLFADLVGFTPYAEERDAEEVRELLTRYFDLAREIIERYGGVVEKFIGDAVMAVFGAHAARENDAERAVRAALELVGAVSDLGPGLRARAGVLTGEAAVTLGATNQGLVAGDLVNTASRLQSVAPVGSVLVGEATQRATAGSILYEAAGPQVLKGRTDPVPAWRALRVVAEVGGRNRSDVLEAPFVGRDDEMRLLKDLFHATSREQRARLVSITGPAGIGKSRLAWEFSKYSDGVVEEVWWHQGRSPAYGEGISFWALGEMVRARCRLLEGDDERTTRSRVAATVAEHVPDEAERRWIEPALLALLGVGQPPSGGEALFAAWRTFFERMAQSGVLVMLFEDLHWADAGTLDFIDHVLDWSKGLPFYVVTLSRPELLDRRPDWGAGKRSFTSLFLEPLAESAMRELLAGLVPGLPESAVGAIVSRADGVPLYAVETVRMLLADGKLREEGGRYVPAGDLSSLAVPGSLTALISARLDALDPVDRGLLQDASVLGVSFTPASLGAIRGETVEELEPRLRALVRRELLRLEADPRSPERGQFAFMQALIREVAYHTLARRDRRSRHLAAARWFESLGGDELAGVLARHYFAAHQASPAGHEADALAAQARVALLGAADRALGLGSHDQAIGFLREALAVTTDPAAEAALLTRIGVSASEIGEHDVAESSLRAALALRRADGDPLASAAAMAALAQVLLNAYRTDTALALLEEAPPELADHPDHPATIDLRAQLARAAMFSGDARRALAVSEQVLEAAEHANLIPVVADALVTKGTALASVGRLFEGSGVIEAARQLAEVHGLQSTVMRALNNQCVLLAASDPRRALQSARQLLELARRAGSRSMLIHGLSNASSAALRTGDWRWAMPALAAHLHEDLERSDRATVLAAWAEFTAVTGEPTAAIVAELEVLLEGDTDVQTINEKDAALGWVALGEGRDADARDRFREARSEEGIAAQAGYFAMAARASLWLGDLEGVRDELVGLEHTGAHGPSLEMERQAMRAALAAADGRPMEALAAYREALAAAHDLALRFDATLITIDLAVSLGADLPEVRAASDAARGTLAELGAAPFLARLDALVPPSPATAAPASAHAAVQPT